MIWYLDLQKNRNEYFALNDQFEVKWYHDPTISEICFKFIFNYVKTKEVNESFHLRLYFRKYLLKLNISVKCKKIFNLLNWLSSEIIVFISFMYVKASSWLIDADVHEL